MLVVFAFVQMWIGLNRLKRRTVEKIISKKIINRPDFSTSVMRKIAYEILKLPQKAKIEALKAVEDENLDKLADKIKSENLRKKILFLWNGKQSLVRMKDTESRLLTIKKMLRCQQIEKADKRLQEITLKPFEKALKAQKNILEAQTALYDGDMLTATQKASSALRYFQKKNWIYEEAEAYFVLGTAYKVSGIFDTADFMFRNACRLFEFCGASKKEAEVWGNKGLLMAVQKRFEEASDCYQKAKDLFKLCKEQEEICFVSGQEALLSLICDNSRRAEKQAEAAFKKNRTVAGKAFSSDIISRAAYKTGHLRKAKIYALKAAELYQNEKNYAAFFESRYLLAEIYMAQKYPEKAEEVLRDIIRFENSHKTCFHIASAYTLLGVSLLQRGALAQAESFFKKALQYELCNDRAEGIAIDYANLALVEKKCGHKETSLKNIETALSYAKKADENLYHQLKAALK